MNKEDKLFSITAASFIKEFCRPMHNISLTNFMHDITFGNGQISMLVNNANIFKFYYENKIPMLCTDDSGRTLETGIYLNKFLEERYQDCSVLMPLMVNVGKKYNQSFGQTSVHVVIREETCQHLYSLFFDLAENDFLHWVVNNGNYLQEFIDNYNYAAKDILLAAKATENRIVLPNSNQHHASIQPISLTLSLIHKQNKLPIHLSIQQSRCLELLMQGKSAKKIAIEMELSHRTIEHYLDKIRKILGCSSNKELIIFYYDQLHHKKHTMAST